VDPRNGVHVFENVATIYGIPRFAVLLTPACEEEEPDDDCSRYEHDPRDDLEERRHS